MQSIVPPQSTDASCCATPTPTALLDVPVPRKSMLEAVLKVVYEFMCLIAVSNITQFTIRSLVGLLVAHITSTHFVPTVC
ncbi:hypothetical protein GUJ93_ZPchr0008g12163 [Zizania palustris]|uniref:Uncharacterized protein n=1 Tax=Zizania palustris TaxID=103762 RepID=A0A8J5V1Y2_ZIZPA|nr:hypothetical protein GUJ93_ZPchr0008g12163 [Zizania palustris]